MSTVDQLPPALDSVHKRAPVLQNGDYLTRTEFERRFDATPGLKKADLIEGIVYLSSPVSVALHGRPHSHLTGWLGQYVARTSGLDAASSASVRLDEANMPQPDAVLFMPEEVGGRAHVDQDDYVSGPPDLVCEVATSNVSIDLHGKLNVYRRNGVREYLVLRTQDQAVDWFQLKDGAYVPMTPHEDGLLKSNLFSGLWLDPAALLAGDLPKLFAAVDAGTSTDEHRAFVEKLLASRPD